MTQEEKRTMLNNLVGETLTSGVADVYLALSKDKILHRRFPFNNSSEKEIPGEYEIIQVELATRLYLKRGAEGETGHNENGVNRIYDSVDDWDILDKITPIAKVV